MVPLVLLQSRVSTLASWAIPTDSSLVVLLCRCLLQRVLPPLHMSPLLLEVSCCLPATPLILVHLLIWTRVALDGAMRQNCALCTLALELDTLGDDMCREYLRPHAHLAHLLIWTSWDMIRQGICRSMCQNFALCT